MRNSPPIALDEPVSRQYEEAYFDYFGWPYYWEGSGLWGDWQEPNPLGTLIQPPAVVPQQSRGDPHLRSTSEVAGYHIQASDGSIGHVDDFLLDDKSWAIRYLVIATSNWWFGHRVLIAPQWVAEVSWPEARIHVDVSRERIQDAPAWDPKQPITRDYEQRLYDYYRQPPYWQPR